MSYHNCRGSGRRAAKTAPFSAPKSGEVLIWNIFSENLRTTPGWSASNELYPGHGERFASWEQTLIVNTALHMTLQRFKSERIANEGFAPRFQSGGVNPSDRLRL